MMSIAEEKAKACGCQDHVVTLTEKVNDSTVDVVELELEAGARAMNATRFVGDPSDYVATNESWKPDWSGYIAPGTVTAPHIAPAPYVPPANNWPNTTTWNGALCDKCGAYYFGAHYCPVKGITTATIKVDYDEEKLDRLIDKLEQAVSLIKQLNGPSV